MLPVLGILNVVEKIILARKVSQLKLLAKATNSTLEITLLTSAGILSPLKPRVLAETLGYWPKP
jgi:hypothetical protein